MVARQAGFKCAGRAGARSAAARAPLRRPQAEAVAQQRDQVFDLVQQLHDAFHAGGQRRSVPRTLALPLTPAGSSASAAKAPRTLSAQDL